MTYPEETYLIAPFNDRLDQFYGIVHNDPVSSASFTSSIDTSTVNNYRDGLYLRTVNDYFNSDQVKLTVLPTMRAFVDRPNGVVDHTFPEYSLLGLASIYSYTVNGSSVLFRDQIQGVDQCIPDETTDCNLPGMVQYFKQSSAVLDGTEGIDNVYPFFVDESNQPQYNGYVIEPFPFYNGFIRYVQNPLSAQTGLRGSAFLGLDDGEGANPLGSALIDFGCQRNLGSQAEYNMVQPRTFVDSGTELILVKPNGMFVGATTQRENDVLSPISCSYLTPWRDEYSGESFLGIFGTSNLSSLKTLLGKSLPDPSNPAVNFPYYALDGYAFGHDLDMEQTRDKKSTSAGWSSDTAYNQSALYGTDSITFAGYTR